MINLLIKLFIKDNKNTTNPKVRKKYINLGSGISILCNIILFIIKFSVGLFSKSVSVMADAFNNLSDIGSGAVTAIGYRLSEKPADKEHPFGHGRIEYMSALAVAVIIILVGVELFESSFNKVLNPTEINVNLYTICLLVISVLIKLWMFFFNKKIGKLICSNALVATAQDSINDTIATSAVLLSTLISHFFSINIDPYIGMAVSIFIIYSGVMTIKETINPLLGTPPEKKVIEDIASIVNSYSDFLGIHDLIIHNYGPGRSFASLHVEVSSEVDIVAIHEDIDACEKQIFKSLGIETVIHMDPLAVNDETTVVTKNMVEKAIITKHNRLSIHDFRMVTGENQINLIFDVVVPSDFYLKDKEIKKEISAICKEIDSRFEVVLTVDKDYSLEG